MVNYILSKSPINTQFQKKIRKKRTGSVRSRLANHLGGSASARGAMGRTGLILSRLTNRCTVIASALSASGYKKQTPGQKALVASDFHEQPQVVPLMTGSMLR